MESNCRDTPTNEPAYRKDGTRMAMISKHNLDHLERRTRSVAGGVREFYFAGVFGEHAIGGLGRISRESVLVPVATGGAIDRCTTDGGYVGSLAGLVTIRTRRR